MSIEGSDVVQPILKEDTGLTVVMVPTPGPSGHLVDGHCYKAFYRLVSAEGVATESDVSLGHVTFQNGPIPVNGINGWTNEALLCVLIDRTERLDAKFPCEENKQAILSMKSALASFNERTSARRARGVEGQLVR